MKNLENRMQQLLVKLIKEKDKMKRVDCLEEVLSLDKLYVALTGETFEDKIAEYSFEEDFQVLDNKVYTNFRSFTANYEKEIDYHELLSKNAVLTLCDNFELGQIMDYDSTIEKNIMKEIILSFFEKKLKEFYPLIKKFYQENNFYFLEEEWSNKVCAQTLYLPHSKQSLIIVNDTMNLHTMVSIVHELGHMICYHELKDVSTMDKSYFFEVFSYTLERLFANYLIQENFLTSECMHYLREEDNVFFESADHLCFLTKFSSLNLDISYNVKNWNDFFKKYPDVDIDKEMYRNLNLKDTLAYFYGYLLSLEYEQQFKKNPEQTIQYLRNLNFKNGIYPMKELFSTSNLSIDEISKMKTLKKRLDCR